ncbi:GntR family transcriptional regulator [Streptomyces scabiei]|uniref:GntR family transcriptional regulator n=1 Tax=Streptomyces scabiei TaxID=1930 RepID=UPI0029B4BE1F|nr:GntR family transcriptional regulator [Streptomyces scabiei]MDX3122764.1 GntR family transcriptional regulator [Streptomyces scabiei]MDX3199363.1 GntR family transcriptional regulator [Streptomyces scabiei]MDX3223197.1 GntR family transcriptional regulator [Streptomyces scabiei]
MSVAGQDPTSHPAYWRVPDAIVTDALRGRILHGAYAITEPLPSEAQLADELDLPEKAVGTALRALTREGTLCVVPDRGTFVARLPRLESPDEAAERVGTILRARLEQGVYRVGTWFPSQNRLLDEFGVTLYVLLNVVSALEKDGLLSAVVSRGRYVLDPASTVDVPRRGTETGRAEVARAVREGIANGTLPPHTQILSRKQLGEQYGITAYDVKVALQPLVDEGLLTAHGGRGTYVADRPQAGD